MNVNDLEFWSISKAQNSNLQIGSTKFCSFIIILSTANLYYLLHIIFVFLNIVSCYVIIGKTCAFIISTTKTVNKVNKI